jgi:crossover junction endodeoxyribonuclease RuvC
VTDRILGIDPGSRVTGYGVIELEGQNRRLVECGVIKTKSTDPLPLRLQMIHEGLTDVMQRCGPDSIAIESVFAAKNVRSTIILSQARGAILLSAALANLPVHEYSPATIKKTIVGNGRAAKDQVGYMVQQLLRLKTAPTPDDAADAVAIALTQAMTVRL